MTIETMSNFTKKIREQLCPLTSDDEDSPWHRIDRSVSAVRTFEPAPAWDSSIPHIIMIIEYSNKTATLVAREEVPEDMMFYLLDCLQQRTGFEGSHATRDTVREINVWIKKQLKRMIEEKMLWKEEKKWIFEG